MKFKSLLFFILISLFAAQFASAQQKFYTSIVKDTIQINFDNHYKLSHPSIIPFSEIIILKGKVLPSKDYIISYSTASFILSDSLAYSAFDTLIVSYETVNLSLQKEYKKRILAYKFDEKLGDTVRVSKSESEPFTAETIFGSGMEKSGTIVRGFTVGTNQDFSLNSGLRLQLSGRLSKEIEIVAALTDQNTPIQPEGNTATIDQLDNVFIQIKHPNAAATFGDYTLQKQMGEFGPVDRKLQGLLGEFNLPGWRAGYGGQKAYIAIASSRGKFTTNSFSGSDGVQGPYILTGTNNERNIIIIAGTEKVYIDGIEMKRGERNDYTIDYANAQLTFTPNRLITSASRISIDFEYSDQRYQRTFFGTGVESSLFNDKLGIKFQYLREGDNQDAPIDVALSDSDKALLAAAGNNPSKATKSGITLAKPDSLGQVHGTYMRIDTVINGAPYSYYVYNPGGLNSIYNVVFSYVGTQQGDYINESIGDYKFVGINQGNYAPVILLPLPELKQNGNLAFNYKPGDGVNLSVEYAGSIYNRNRFSSVDNNNFGYATNILFKVDPRKIEIGKISLGEIGLSYHDRFIQDKYSAPDRINPVEFNRYYNITPTTTPESQQLRELNITLIPISELNISSSYGLLTQGSDFKSTRYNNTVKFSDNKNFGLDYNLDYVSSENLSFKSYWLRQRGQAYYNFWKIKPGIGFLAENKNDKQNGADSLLSTSLKYYEVDPFLELVDFYGLHILAKYSLRDDYAPLAGVMQNQAASSTQSIEINYNGSRKFSSTLNLTVNNKNYSDAFKKIGYLNSQTILVRSQSKFNFWSPVSGDFYYEVSTQKSAKLQKVFVQVPQGTGNYIYLGDLNHNGIADENEFQPTLYNGNYVLITVPTDQLYPVIDLKTSTRWKIVYGDIFDKGSTLEKILKPFSSETSWRVEENSTEPDYKKIYLLHFSDFQKEATTIQGSNFIQQDLYIFENNRALSFRLRYAQTKSLNQYSGGSERIYNREESIRINFKMVEEISNQTDIVNQTDNVGAPVISNLQKEISGNNITSDFSYRPERNIEVGFVIKVGRSQDDFPSTPTIINLNSQTLRFNLSFASTGRLRIELERDELRANTTNNFIPFELTSGNLIGKNYYWRFNFDYRLAANLQSTIGYEGRALGKENTVHTARAEVRAYF
ncbi:MAG: hypothetical protein ACYCVH_00075 [Ignavibacteriaceae bacterium]